MKFGIKRFVENIGVIAWNTLRQVVRMRVYGLVIAAVVLVVLAGFLDLPFVVDQGAPGAGALMMMKSSGFGAINLFAVGLAIAGVSVTVSDEIRNRTLYLVFSKQVLRLEYLLGKWLGVMLSIAVGVIAIEVFFYLALMVKESGVVEEQLQLARAADISGEKLLRLEQEIRAQGAQPELHWGAFAAFAKASVVAAITLLMVFLSRSAIFAMGASFFVVLIGMFQSDALGVMTDGAGWLSQLFAGLVGVLFPNMKLYDAFDWSGVMQLGLELQIKELVFLTGLYLTVYLGLAWAVFSRREL